MELMSIVMKDFFEQGLAYGKGTPNVSWCSFHDFQEMAGAQLWGSVGQACLTQDGLSTSGLLSAI